MPTRRIGLDIGYCHVRAVSLVRKGRSWRVAKTGSISRFDDQGARKSLARCLTELGSVVPLSGEVTVASSDLAVMVRFEHNHPMPPDRLERVLRLELTQHAPGGEGDLAADAVPIPIDGDDLIHCCGLAQPDEVVALLDECKGGGVKPRRVQLAPGALGGITRSLPVGDGEPDEFDLLVDIGGKTSRVVLVQGDDLVACRQLSIGGDQFTEALAKARRWRFDQAERAKQAADYQAIHGKAETMASSAVSAEMLGPGPAGASADSGDSAGEDLISFDDEPTDDDVLSFDDPPASADTHQPPANDGLTLDGDIGDAPHTAPDASPEIATAPKDQRPAKAEFQLSDSDPSDDDLSLDGPGSDSGFQPLSLSEQADDSSGLTLQDEQDAEALSIDPGSASEGDVLSFDESGETDPNAVTTVSPASSEDDAEAPEAWQRDTSGFELDEPDVPAAGAMTQVIGGTVLGPELARVADDLHAQLMKTITWFGSQLRRRDLRVARVKLVGAGADLAGLVPYLNRRFGVRVTVADPFASLEGERPSSAHHYAAALGLAMAGTPGVPTWDLRPERIQAGRIRRQLVWPPRIAAGLLAAAGLVQVARCGSVKTQMLSV